MKIQIVQKTIPYSRYLLFQEKSRKKRWESILFLEHPPTLTYGTGTKSSNLLVVEEKLKALGIAHHKIQRGGDYTAHEPGQLVIYPHIDLAKRKIPIMDFIRNFREMICQSVWEVWNVKLMENPESPGLYLQEDPKKKLVSFGIYFKSYFTSFGASVNISNNLETFQMINPCGGKAEDIVSIQKLGGNTLNKTEFLGILREKILRLF